MLVHDPCNAVSRDASGRIDNGNQSLRQPVQQRALSDVGTTDDRHFRNSHDAVAFNSNEIDV